jgi:hypothetical protein
MKYKIVWIFFFLISLYAKKTYAVTPPVVINLVQDSTAYSLQELQKDTASLYPITLDEEQIKDYQDDSDFDYTEALEEDNWWTHFKQWLNDVWSSFIRWLTGSDEISGTGSVLIRLLPYLIIASLVGLLIWVFMKMDTGQLTFEKRQTAQAFLSDDEELIKRDDIQTLIDKAISAGNYRLAIRFYYLLTLQKMSGKELINWQVQKTNHEYIYEVEDPNVRNQFRRVTDIYDYIWYGNFEVDEDAFQKAQSTFVTLTSQL